jgi:hypothetical protein
VRRGLFGSAGARDSLRPRRPSGVVVRPLNFTVRRRVMAVASFVRSSLRGWRLWIAVVLGLEVCWFVLLYPLIPRSALGALVESVLPLPLAGYVYLMFRAFVWLGGSPLSPGVRRFCATSLAISVALFAFLLVYGAQRIVSAGFGRGLVTSWF